MPSRIRARIRTLRSSSYAYGHRATTRISRSSSASCRSTPRRRLACCSTISSRALRWDLDNAINQSDIYAKATETVSKEDKTLKYSDQTASYQGIGLNGTAGKLYGGAAYRHFDSNLFKNVKGFKNDADEANIWSVGAGYTFDKNEKAESDATAHNIQLNYKGAQKANKGSWGAYTAYRYMGQNVAFAPTYETFLGNGVNNVKGWEVGTGYTMFKNVQLFAKYFNGKDIAADKDAEKLFGRVDVFF